MMIDMILSSGTLAFNIYISTISCKGQEHPALNHFRVPAVQLALTFKLWSLYSAVIGQTGTKPQLRNHSNLTSQFLTVVIISVHCLTDLCCNALLNLARELSITLRSCLEFVSTPGLQITLKVFSNVLFKSMSILMSMSLSTSIQLTKEWFGRRDSFYIKNGWHCNHCGLCDYILDFLKWFRVECLIALVVQNLTTFIIWGKIFTFMAKKDIIQLRVCFEKTFLDMYINFFFSF